MRSRSCSSFHEDVFGRDLRVVSDISMTERVHDARQRDQSQREKTSGMDERSGGIFAQSPPFCLNGFTRYLNEGNKLPAAGLLQQDATSYERGAHYHASRPAYHVSVSGTEAYQPSRKKCRCR